MEKLTENEVIDTLKALDKGIKMAQNFDLKEFSDGYQKAGAFNPSMQNQLMKSLNISTISPDKDAIEAALKDPANNEDRLTSYGQSYYFSSLMYKRNHEYLANLPSFDLELECINAKKEDYKTSKYKNDYQVVSDFLDKFDYRNEFKKILWNMLMNETYYGMFRKLDSRYVIQEWPIKYAKISGSWEYGLLFDIDMGWFLQPQVDIDLYPDWLKKQYIKMFYKGKPREYIPSNKINEHTGSFGVWSQTSPEEGFWCFKFNQNHNLQVPFFTGMLPEMAILPLLRNLQLSQSLAAARKLLVSSIPYLQDKKSSSVANALAIDAEVLGKFIGLATQGLEEGIKVLPLPTQDIKGVEYENTDKDTYVNFMSIASSLLSGGKVIFSTDKRLNVYESQLSTNLDELLIESIYPQFQNFLEYYINQETKKFKWKFRFVGCNDFSNRERRQKEVWALAEKGVVLPNKIASSYGLNKIELERELEEANENGFTDKLMMMININTAKTGGRPQSSLGNLGDSGLETRNTGNNIEKGGNI